MRRRAQHAPSHAVSHERASSLSEPNEQWLTQPANGSARGLNHALLPRRKRFRTRGLARARSRGNTRVDARNSCACPCTRCLSIVLTRRFQVKRTFAHAAGHRQRTCPEPRALTCARTQCCCTRGLARDRSRVHTCACATRFSRASGRMRFSKAHADGSALNPSPL